MSQGSDDLGPEGVLAIHTTSATRAFGEPLAGNLNMPAKVSKSLYKGMITVIPGIH